MRYSNNNSCSTTIPAPVDQSLAFPLFRQNAYPVSFMNLALCFVARMRVQLNPFLLDPQYLAAPSTGITKHITSAYPQSIVLPFPRLSDSGTAIKSVVMIYCRRDADGFGKGRPTVRTSGSFFSYYIICIYTGTVPVSSLKCRYSTLEVLMV